MTHSESCCIKNVKVDFSSYNDMTGYHIRINWRINFGTVSMVRIQVNVFLSGPIQNQSTMEANKRYHMFKFPRKVLSGL